MLQLLRRVSRYLTAFFSGRFDDMADPKVQLEQAIDEAKAQHRLLVEQAANVIGNQKSIEMQLSRKIEELELLNRKARQAVLMADDEQKKGDSARSLEFTSAAESFAGRLVSLDGEVESLKDLHRQASQASAQAKKAVQQNAAALQKKLADRQRLLSQLDQAKMQERMNAAMASLSETVGGDTPTFDEIQRKIEERQARALGQAELRKGTYESDMFEVEQAMLEGEANRRLDSIKAELGIALSPGELKAGEPDKVIDLTETKKPASS